MSQRFRLRPVGNKAIRWLRSTRGVKVQIMLLLFAARCYKSVRITWLSNYSSFLLKSGGVSSSSKIRTVREDDADEEEGNIIKLKEGKSGFVAPKMHAGLWLYQQLSTIIMIYCLVKNTLPLHLWWDRWQANPHSPSTGHCLFLGQFILLYIRNEYAGMLFSSFHLLWRIIQSEWYRRLDFNMIEFLYQDRKEIGAEQRRLEQQERRRGWAPRNEHLTPDEHYLRALMCYRVRWNHYLISYRLRSNRTQEAKLELERRLTKVFLASFSLFFALALIVTPTVTLSQFTDGPYLARYPHCSPQLEEMMARGEASWWSLTPTRHRLLAFWVDMVVNVPIWVDSGIALTLVVGLTYMLNYDLLYYWNQIHGRLVKLEQRLRHQRRFDEELAELEMVAGGPWATTNGIDLVELGESSSRIKWAMEEMSDEVYELQAEIGDFFKQLRKADGFVSDLITATVIIWLVSFGLSGLVYGTLEHKMEIRAIQALGLFVIMTENFILLELSMKVKKSYVLICTLMALDQSIHKVKFRAILELFAQRHSRGPYYSLAHAMAYRSSTFLSLVGWTFSLAALTETFFYRWRRAV